MLLHRENICCISNICCSRNILRVSLLFFFNQKLNFLESCWFWKTGENNGVIVLSSAATLWSYLVVKNVLLVFADYCRCVYISYDPRIDGWPCWSYTVTARSITPTLSEYEQQVVHRFSKAAHFLPLWRVLSGDASQHDQDIGHGGGFQ